MKTVLTIAGSDCSGGAGIQADIKTMIMNNVYAMSAISALTAQNTLGVKEIFEIEPSFLKKQIDAVFEDIFPDAVKIGMVSSRKLIYAIAERLKFYGAKHIVADPVMIATSGVPLISDDAVCAMTDLLFPLAEVVTPNICEAEVLADMKISGKNDMLTAARRIGDKWECAVLLKGGHNIDGADDLLYNKDKEFIWFEGKRINTSNTHGTGCTLSSAVASNLAKGYTLDKAVQEAKRYITAALEANLDIGHGNGPINHGFIFAE